MFESKCFRSREELQKTHDEGIDEILSGLSKGPLIFNLGHGITPQTPIAHVEQLVGRVRGYS